jgi:hypothetical protein
MSVPSVSAEDGSLWQGGSALRSNEKYDALERVFSFLRSGSDQDVQNIILQIRSNRSVEDITAFSTNRGLASVSTQNNKAEWERIETEERRIGIVGAEGTYRVLFILPIASQLCPLTSMSESAGMSCHQWHRPV